MSIIDNRRYIFIFIKCIKNLHKPFYLRVGGDSMYPFIKNGDMISIMPYRGTKINIGDIILYNKFHTHLTVHRVINITCLGMNYFSCKTKGDNNAESDSYDVFNNEILGIVKHSFGLRIL
jgi:signal peptidase I